MKALMHVFATVMVGLSCVSAPQAQTPELRSLQEIIGGDYEASYPFIRCAAYFQSVVEWAGVDRLGEHVVSQTESAKNSNIFAAVMFRSGGNAEVFEAELGKVVRDVGNVVEIYLARFHENYASTGNALTTDAVWVSDTETCRQISQMLLTANSKDNE